MKRDYWDTDMGNEEIIKSNATIDVFKIRNMFAKIPFEEGYINGIKIAISIIEDRMEDVNDTN